MLTKICACLGLAMVAGCVPVMNAYKLQKAQSEVNANKPDEAQATLDSCFDSHSAENIVGILWAVSLGAYYTPICMLYKNSDPTFIGLEKQIAKEQQSLQGVSNNPVLTSAQRQVKPTIGEIISSRISSGDLDSAQSALDTDTSVVPEARAKFQSAISEVRNNACLREYETAKNDKMYLESEWDRAKESCAKSPNGPSLLPRIQWSELQSCTDAINEAFAHEYLDRLDDWLSAYQNNPFHDEEQLARWKATIPKLQAKRARENALASEEAERARGLEVARLNKLIDDTLMKTSGFLEVTDNCTSSFDDTLASQWALSIDPSAATAFGLNPYATKRDETQAQAKVLMLNSFAKFQIVWQRERSCLEKELQDRGISTRDSRSIIDCISKHLTEDAEQLRAYGQASAAREWCR